MDIFTIGLTVLSKMDLGKYIFFILLFCSDNYDSYKCNFILQYNNEVARKAIQKTAVELEYTTNRYVFVNEVDGHFIYSLWYLKQTQDRCYDCPPLRDAKLFPFDKEYVLQCLNFNYAFRSRLESFIYNEYSYHMMIYPPIIREATTLHEIWYNIYYAINIEAECRYRRLALKELRDKQLGWNNYYMGIVPPHVPYWRFANID